MAQTLQQRRKNNIFLVVGILAALAVVGVVPLLWKALYVPDWRPGYLKAAPSAAYQLLSWGTLEQASWEGGGRPDVPADLQALEGTKVAIKGFLLPLHQRKRASEIYLAPKPRGCYVCQPPAINQVAMITIAGGKEVEQVPYPVTAYGTLRIATGLDGEETLYMLDETQLLIGHK